MRGLLILDLHPKRDNNGTNNRGRTDTRLYSDCLKGGKMREGVKRSLFRYDEIIDALIKGQKLRYQYPNADLCLRVDRSMIDEHPNIIRILSNMYDHIVEKDINFKGGSGNRVNNHYEMVRKMDINQVGLGDDDFDTDYEYHLVKEMLGPVTTKHFMFKERDLELIQRGGFNFNKKKIKFKHKTDNPTFNIVKEMYEVNDRDIRNFHLKYYHTDKNKNYRPYNVKPMFEDVESFDYLMPLEKLSSYHSKNNYYTNLLAKHRDHIQKACDDKIRLNLIDAISPADRDEIVLQYLKCRKDMYVITLWRPAIPVLDEVVELLEKNGVVSYIKTVNLSKKGLLNMMMLYYDDFSLNTAYEFSQKKLDYVDTEDENNPVCVILFDNINKKPVSGQGAKFKREIRDSIIRFLKEMNIVPEGSDRYRGNDLVHINDYFYQTVEYGQLLFNQNSLDMLELRDTEQLLSDEMTVSHLKFQTLRKVLYSNMSLLEMGRFIAVGGTTLYALGVRSFNDIDSIVIGIEPNVSQHLTTFVETIFTKKDTKIFFLDGGIEGSTFWNENWMKKDRLILDTLKINDYKELTTDPNNYFYYMGVKMVLFNFEILRKIIRNRTEDHVDFMMMNLLNIESIKQYVTLADRYQTDDSVVDSTDSISDTLSDETDETHKIEYTGGPYFKIAKHYRLLAGRYDDRFPQLKHKVLFRRYSLNQISKVRNLQPFKDMFGNLSIQMSVSDSMTDTDI